MFRYVLLLMVLGVSLYAQTYYQPTNMNFETGEIGELPIAWDITNSAEKGGYEAFLDLTAPFSGKYYAKLQKIGEPDKEKDSIAPAGSLFQRIDALAYRGNKIKFKVALKNEFGEYEGSTYLFIQVKKAEKEEGFFDVDFDKPLEADDWTYHEITADIPKDANQIRYGVILKGKGTVYIDDASIEIVQPEGSVNEPPKELSQKEIDNLYSLAKLYGYVRFYYPSGTNKNMDWDMFMLNSVHKVLNAKDSLQLAETLENLFKYPAPLLAVDFNNISTKKDIEKPENAIDKYALSWMHSGGFSPRSTDYIYSIVQNVYNSIRPREAAAFQVLEISQYRGETLKVTCDIKTENASVASGAMLWLRVDDDIKKMRAFESSSRYPGDYPEWIKVETDITIPENGELLRLGAVFVGEGIALFDNFTAVTESGDTIELKNPGFEENEVGRLERGWLVPGTVFDAGYDANVQTKYKTEKDKALMFSSSTEDRILFPRIGRIFDLKLNGNMYAHMPSVLYADSTDVLPKPDFTPEMTYPGKPSGYFPNANDRTSRLAITAMAWSIIDNFGLRNISDDENHKIFTEIIAKAAEDKNNDEFIVTLRKLLENTKDSQARVWYENEYYNFALPFLIEHIGSKLYVEKVHNSVQDKIKPGYEITEINGQPAYKYIAGIASGIPSSSKNWSLERAIAMFRAGAQGTEVNMKFTDTENNSHEYDISRDITLRDLYPDRLPEVYEVDSTTLYLDITVLTDKFFKENLGRIDLYDNLILDARGSADVSAHTLGLFIESPILSVKWEIPVYTYPNKNIISKKSVQAVIKPHNKLPGKKVVMLADERSIGYTEGIIRIAQQYRLATIIGRQTAGMPGDILAFRLPGNYNFSMTIMRAYAPDGTLITGKPVIPDIDIETTREDLINDIDPILKKGLDFFTK